MFNNRTFIADIVALDANSHPVLYVELRRSEKDREVAQRQLESILSHYTPVTVPFGMLVDPQNIEIFQWDGQNLYSCLIIPTNEVFSYYDPEVVPTEILEPYMGRLVEGWIRDMAYHWKLENPPYFVELKDLGLAQLLQDGTTLSEQRLMVA